jgi:hypothetical protein
MSLEKWQENHWLTTEATSRNEIKDLLTIVERDLKDADVSALSEDRRFEAAFNAARTLANIAVRACGYRVPMQLGHHAKMIESLELTVHADSKLINRLKAFSKKRNATSYDSAGNVSKQELESVIQTAGQMKAMVLAWLQDSHPELLKD